MHYFSTLLPFSQPCYPMKWTMPTPLPSLFNRRNYGYKLDMYSRDIFFHYRIFCRARLKDNIVFRVVVQAYVQVHQLIDGPPRLGRNYSIDPHTLLFHLMVNLMKYIYMSLFKNLKVTSRFLYGNRVTTYVIIWYVKLANVSFWEVKTPFLEFNQRKYTYCFMVLPYPKCTKI